MRKVLFIGLISTGLITLSLFLVFTPITSLLNKKSITNELNMKIESLEGNEFYLADYVGQSLILNFFASWCASCELQAKILKDFNNDFSDIAILSISVDPLFDTIERLKEYKKENNFSWVFGRDIELKGEELFDSSQLPTVAYINSQGILQELKHSIVSRSELEDWFNQIHSTRSTFIVFGLEVSSAIGLPLFFLVGLYSALSPCLFPIMPLTLFRILSKQSKGSKLGEDKIKGDDSNEGFVGKRLEVLYWSFLLWSGILFSFEIFSLIGIIIGFILIQYYVLLNLIFGVIIVILGIIILIPKFHVNIFSRIPVHNKLYSLLLKEKKLDIDIFALGFFYSIISLPCAGPTFLAVLPLIVGTVNPLYKLIGLLLLAIGLLVPYLVLILLTNEARSKFINKIQQKYSLIKAIMAIFLIVIGLILIWPFFGGPIIFSY